MLIQGVIAPPAQAQQHLATALGPQLTRDDVSWFQPADWRLKMATFGYLAFGDMTKVEDALIDEIARQPPMRLRMGRLVALPEEGDDSVWVELEGDLDQLAILAQELPGWVHRLGYLLDRYSFRPRIRLARISSRTTVDYLETLLTQVDRYVGPEWIADALQIVRRKPDGTPTALYRTHSSLPFATAHADARVGVAAAVFGSAPALPSSSSRLPVPRGRAAGPSD